MKQTISVFSTNNTTGRYRYSGCYASHSIFFFSENCGFSFKYPITNCHVFVVLKVDIIIKSLKDSCVLDALTQHFEMHFHPRLALLASKHHTAGFVWHSLKYNISCQTSTFYFPFTPSVRAVIVVKFSVFLLHSSLGRA